MLEFAKWLATTRTSAVIQDVLWIIPVAQCIHILSITLIIGAVWMINLRILGFSARSQTLAAAAQRFIPWIWFGLAGAATTGIVMIIGEPVRELVNPAFWAKMGLLTISIVSAALFQVKLTRNVAFWEQRGANRQSIRILAVLSVLIWVAIVVLGRLIAYSQVII